MTQATPQNKNSPGGLCGRKSQGHGRETDPHFRAVKTMGDLVSQGNAGGPEEDLGDLKLWQSQMVMVKEEGQ